jgi:hypothetical protein
MCCAEGQHCHILHPVRELDHNDENEFNEWVDTHCELHVSTAETVKDTAQHNTDDHPHEHTTRIPVISSKLGHLLSSEKNNGTHVQT